MQQIKKKLSLLMVLLLLIPAFGLYAQEEVHFKDARTGTIGLRVAGGTSWAFGSRFENIGANQMNLIQPFGEAGMFVNISPAFRLGADYSFTRMVREQLFTSLNPLLGNSLLPGSVSGTLYRDFQSNFHAASLTGELDLVQLFSGGRSKGKVALWLGTGVGYMFVNGSTWSLNISNIMRSDNWTQTVTFGGNNEDHKYNALYVPGRLSLEYAFLPQVALSLGGEYRFLPTQNSISPRHMAIAKVGLVFNLTTKNNPASPRYPSPLVEPVHDTTYIDKIVEKVVEKRVEVPVTKGLDITDAMLPYVTFVRGSAVLDEDVNAPALAALLSVLKADPEARFDILGWTDHKGTAKINDPLSTKRAEALRDYLVGHGIDASRIGSVEGHGNYPISGEARFSVVARRAEAKLRK